MGSREEFYGWDLELGHDGLKREEMRGGI